jgi:CopG family nickel-responsive transcriptional regulator
VNSPTQDRKSQPGVTRISVSLPQDVCLALDNLVLKRGFGSRSQALTSMITEHLIGQSDQDGENDDVMTGTITLFYNQRKNNLLTRLAALKRDYLNEVIGSLQVQLVNDHIMEVILIQGPSATLRKISDTFLTCKGVKGSKLTLTSTIIPQLHPLNSKS